MIFAVDERLSEIWKLNGVVYNLTSFCFICWGFQMFVSESSANNQM